MLSKAFKDRRSAGQALARQLQRMELPEPVVLAMPRGGVPVAVEIARALDAPVDLVLVRKIGAPYQPELAAAAVVNGEEPEIVENEEVMRLAGIDRDYVKEQAKEELLEIERRRRTYLKDRARVPIKDRTVVLVDDGIATGTSIRAAIAALRRKGPKRLILAVPVAPIETLQALRQEVDDVICLSTPEPFYAIGLHYGDFHQVSDGEVIQLLSDLPAMKAPARDPEQA
jgi:putative phosphoribosyl transferase